MARPLKVLLVGPLPPPSGGMANQTRQLKRLLEGEGVEVALVQTNAPYRPAWVSHLRGLRAVFRLMPYLRALAAEAQQADVVHVMANSGWAWYLLAAPAVAVARRQRRPTIVNYRGGLAEEFLEKSAGRVRNALRGARLVVPSRFLHEVFARYGMQAQVIPNVVDTQVFRPVASRPVADVIDAPHVVIARNLEAIYGIDLGLRALAVLRRSHPDLRASIAGSGPERASLEALAAELGLTHVVKFTGRLDVPGMVALYQSADLVLNPVRVDNTPNSVLEALACGVPVVSTNVGGVPYLVEHESTAVLVPPESPEALAEGMTRVLGEPELRRNLVSRGLALADRCSWPRVRDLWLDTYAAAAA